MTKQVITIRKLDHKGREVWHYAGTLLDRGESWQRLEALYNGKEKDDGYIVWQKGDRFIEYYYSDRWYNIFEIHDVHTDALKGWYCDVTYPATITQDSVSWRDLALDVWIDPAGNVRVLDEGEFERLDLPVRVHERALQALQEIRDHLGRREAPFDTLQGQLV